MKLTGKVTELRAGAMVEQVGGGIVYRPVEATITVGRDGPFEVGRGEITLRGVAPADRFAIEIDGEVYEVGERVTITISKEQE